MAHANTFYEGQSLNQQGHCSYTTLAIDKFTGRWYCPSCKESEDRVQKSGYNVPAIDPNLAKPNLDPYSENAAFEKQLYFANPPFLDECQNNDHELSCTYQRSEHDTTLDDERDCEISIRKKEQDKALTEFDLYFVCLGCLGCALTEDQHKLLRKTDHLIKVQTQWNSDSDSKMGRNKCWVPYVKYEGSPETVKCTQECPSEYGDVNMAFFKTAKRVGLDRNKTYEAHKSFTDLFKDTKT